MSLRSPLLPSLLLALLSGAPLGAQEDPLDDPLDGPMEPGLSEPEPERVKASLVREREHLTPGQTLWLGVRLQIIPEWHVYWLNPGDAGVPTVITLEGLPKGVSAGPVEWPGPHYYEMAGLASYGYEREVTALIPLRVGEDVAIGTKVPLRVSAEWLVCKEACVPGAAKLEAELVVQAQPGAERAADQKVLARARALAPSPLPEGVAAALEGQTLVVRAKGASELRYFPLLPTDHAPPLTGLVNQGQSLSVEYPAAALKAKKIKGLLALTRGGRTTYHWISASPPGAESAGKSKS